MIRATRRSARVAAAAGIGGSDTTPDPTSVADNNTASPKSPAKQAKPAKRRKIAASGQEASVKEEADAIPTTPKKPKAGKKDGTIPALTRHTPPPAVHLPTALSHLSAADPRFARLSERVPCRPFLGTDGHKDDPFRSLVTSIVGQQVSWLAARSITKRFVEHFCGPVDGDERGDWPFPTAEQVAASNIADLKGVGFSTRKAEYVIELAGHFAEGRLTTDALLSAPDEDVLAALTAVRGIGKWTVDMFLIFTLRRADVLPVGDLGVQKGLLRWVLAAHGALPAPKASTTPRKSLPATPSKTPVEPTEPPTPTPFTLTQTSSTAMDPPATPVTPAKRGLEAASSTATLLNEPSTPTPSNGPAGSSILPATPAPPPVTPSASTNPTLPPAADDSLIAVPADWGPEHAEKAAPLPPGLDIATLRARLAGKKAKGGAYLLPEEMEALTLNWRPYRSVGVFYTWAMAGEK